MDSAPQANNQLVRFQGARQAPDSRSIGKVHPLIIAMLLKRGAISPKAAQRRNLIPPAGQNRGLVPPINSGADSDSETNSFLGPDRNTPAG